MIRVRLSASTAQQIRLLEARIGRGNLLLGILRLFDKEALIAAGFISRTMLSGQALKRHTGALARSVTGRGVMYNGLPAVRVGIFRGPALKYAGVQEYGTQGKNPESPYPTIKPVRAKALAMPVGASLTPAGVDRWGGPRKFPGTLRFVPFRNSGVAIGMLVPAAVGRTSREEGGASRLTIEKGKALYILLRQVDLPARWYLRDGMRAYLPELASHLVKHIRGLMRVRR